LVNEIDVDLFCRVRADKDPLSFENVKKLMMARNEKGGRIESFNIFPPYTPEIFPLKSWPLKTYTINLEYD
jgi:hypothetical protein